MAANVTIKAIEANAVHQIQAGQVIVDLCSVAKELVENGFDAGATAIDVRFKNQGLDSIEVQDNGSGIAAHNYESVALKHYTSKLSNYDDLSTLQTFGFRGEALSSLCALSKFSVITCTQEDAPRATKLEFEMSGKLKSTSVVSGQRGTTVIVEDLFRNLPVRRRELERNIKREWGKVINLLNQYACIQTDVKFTVSQQPTKGKRMVLFSTKGNPSTRENIINVFGVKTMNALIGMDLKLELIPTTGPLDKGKLKEGATAEVRILGYVSRPVHGEGRQTPDRQMFYVNGRPCGLPQFAKVFNEVYRSYNSSQSPFIFADIQLDTHLYDVNVSPDKRTILLHDQGQMLDNLRESLIELFETQDVTIPVSQTPASAQHKFKIPATVRSGPPSSAPGRSIRGTTVDTHDLAELSSLVHRRDSVNDSDDEVEDADSEAPKVHNEHDEEDDESVETSTSKAASGKTQRPSLLVDWLGGDGVSRAPAQTKGTLNRRGSKDVPDDSESVTSEQREEDNYRANARARLQATARRAVVNKPFSQPIPKASLSSGRNLEDSRAQEYDYEISDIEESEPAVPAIPPPSQPPASRSNLAAFARPLRRSAQEVATITIGDQTVTSVLGNPAKRQRIDGPFSQARAADASQRGKRTVPIPSFGGRLTQMFSAMARNKNDTERGLEVTTEELELDEEEEEDEDAEIQDAGQTSTNEDIEDDSLFVTPSRREPIDYASEGSVRGADDQVSVEEDQQSDAVMYERHDNADDHGSHSDHHELSDSGHCHHEADDDADGEYLDEEEKKAREEEKIQAIISAAQVAKTTEEGEKRSEMFVKGKAKRKDMTVNLAQLLKTSEEEIRQRIESLATHLPPPRTSAKSAEDPNNLDAEDAEEKLSLKISKSDFTKMKIVGQFNLGFVLAVREASSSSSSIPSSTPPGTDQSHTQTQQKEDDELFIIDQHASDEKFNFERLQATTTVQSQRLVQPKALDLTALEEEIILENLPALERNGFIVQVDTSGDKPVGSRCQLLSLPLSRETTFSLTDLEELIFLLGDNPTSSATTIPRPSKVRKMFAMRACRSSIMIGKALSKRQMEGVVRHMGEMEKPWNCPHGRPTMRHLCGLGGAWDNGRMWEEGYGFNDERRKVDWKGWLANEKEEKEEEEGRLS
ncbi:mismatch repair endonuclease PMS2 [Cladorrhinum samala]|uniref:DNA mismatch repair protein PMS1 n=1 Tax=Cladorrhinum samala TaxID=585594 RepID=A0AAV9HPP6_9PEZI|nr:mismatch repair endonuclease PMS2 [Cladorrhinum samala]